MHINKCLLLPILLGFIGCTGTKLVPGEYSQAASGAGKTPDYSNLYYWAAHPGKKDPSDSTPRPYRNFTVDSSVDVFFIHPTTYASDTAINESMLADSIERKHWNANLDDAALNYKTDYGTILFQASVFNHYRIFAPRYRQAHLRSFFISDTLSKPFFDSAYADIKNAFEYYLKYENHGRPFIIASHSQGTLHAGRLIKEMIENSPLLNQMVAAYIIGLPVAENYFTKCVPCSTAAQTNCFVTWRTFKNNYVAPWITKETYSAYVINPITWTMDSLPASKKLNRGSVLFKFNRPKSKMVSATIHGNVLWASKPHFFGSIFFTRKNYHIGDINLFWKNIRDNADDRVNAYKRSLNKSQATSAIKAGD
jgi:hypothetical protein